MKDDVKRVSRAEKARLTRRRIVDAAADLFVENGYGTTTLDQVAKQAGVAVQTVYFHFGTKAAVLKEALDVAAVGDDEPVALMERPWFEVLQDERDPRRLIELWVAEGRRIFARVAPMLALVRGAMGTDPELADQWRTNEDQRRTAMRMFAGLLDDRDALRPGLGIDEAADLTLLLHGVENYILATTTLGWSPEQWERTTVDLHVAVLLKR